MQKQDWFKKYDKISFGIITALISTLIGFFMNYFFNSYLLTSLFQKWDLYGEIDFNILSDMMTLALLVPMLIFYITFFRKDYQQFSRGLLLMILPLVIFIIAVSI